MSRAGGENYYREPVKIVIIDTHFVETDAASFKSVVQSLTGKDSVIPGTISKSSSKKRSPTTVVQGGGNNKMTKRMSSSFKSLDRGVSFKDLDRMLMEFPSMDELYRLCAD